YNQYTLQNTRLVDDVLPVMQQHGIGVMNAGPFAARLLTHAPLPQWHRDSKEVQDTAKKAVEFCEQQNIDLAKLAIQFSCAHPELATTISGSANPNNIQKWADWLAEPYEEELIAQVREILAPVHNISHAEGLPENN
ncbi:MAG: aldo/keto reductase, partial [Planctomycetota bacterium]